MRHGWWCYHFVAYGVGVTLFQTYRLFVLRRDFLRVERMTRELARAVMLASYWSGKLR